MRSCRVIGSVLCFMTTTRRCAGTPIHEHAERDAAATV
jgi:hypothetical protein